MLKRLHIILILTSVVGLNAGYYAELADHLKNYNTQKYNETVRKWGKTLKEFRTSSLKEYSGIVNDVAILVEKLNIFLGNIAQNWDQRGLVLDSSIATRLKYDLQEYDSIINKLKTEIGDEILALQGTISRGGTGWFGFNIGSTNKQKLSDLEKVNEFLTNLQSSVQKWQRNLAEIKTK